MNPCVCSGPAKSLALDVWLQTHPRGPSFLGEDTALVLGDIPHPLSSPLEQYGDCGGRAWRWNRVRGIHVMGGKNKIKEKNNKHTHTPRLGPKKKQENGQNVPAPQAQTRVPFSWTRLGVGVSAVLPPSQVAPGQSTEPHPESNSKLFSQTPGGKSRRAPRPGPAPAGPPPT